MEIMARFCALLNSVSQVSLGITCSRPTKLVVSQITCSFLSLFPVTESLAVRGARLNDTAVERQNKMYSADKFPFTEVVNNDTRLVIDTTEDNPSTLYHGEHGQFVVKLFNSGKTTIDEIWVVPARHDRVDILPQSMANGEYLMGLNLHLYYAHAF